MLEIWLTFAASFLMCWQVVPFFVLVNLFPSVKMQLIKAISKSHSAASIMGDVKTGYSLVLLEY